MSSFEEKDGGRMVPSIWVNKPKEELLELLKEEIVRIGIVDSPSRTKYQEKYDNTKTPHPNTYRNIFGCTWTELMEIIGLNYNGQAALERSWKVNTKNAVKWADRPQEELLDVISTEIKNKNITGVQDYIERYDKKNSPSYPTILKVVDGGWKAVQSYYRTKYGREINQRVRK